MNKRKKFIRQYIPDGPTVVWKKNTRTGKLQAMIVHRKGYYRTIAVNA